MNDDGWKGEDTGMAKKHRKHTDKQTNTNATLTDHKTGHSLKEMLNEDALAKLKQMERDMKAAKEREEQEAAERRRRELEKKEKNKSFAELLDDYEKKGGGKYGR